MEDRIKKHRNIQINNSPNIVINGTSYSEGKFNISNIDFNNNKQKFIYKNTKVDIYRIFNKSYENPDMIGYLNNLNEIKDVIEDKIKEFININFHDKKFDTILGIHSLNPLIELLNESNRYFNHDFLIKDYYAHIESLEDCLTLHSNKSDIFLLNYDEIVKSLDKMSSKYNFFSYNLLREELWSVFDEDDFPYKDTYFKINNKKVLLINNPLRVGGDKYFFEIIKRTL